MDETLLYKLALRLATFPTDPSVNNPRLLVGVLPEPFPLNIPLPPGSNVLGSLIRGPHSLQILSDVPLTRAEVSTFYEHELPTRGWSIPQDDARAHWGGFVHRGFSTVDFLNYTYSSGTELHIQISDGEAGITDLRLTLKQNEGSQATGARGRRMHRLYTDAVLPQLTPPRGSLQKPGGSSNGDDSANSNATLQLQESWEIARLAKHYTDQLVQAGWTLIANESSPHAMWSAWDFRIEDKEAWQAVFYLFELPDKPATYHLSLQAELKKDISQESWFA